MKLNHFSDCRLLLAFALIFVLPQLTFCQESLTITTYYPAPFGVYQSLVAERLGVGDNNADGAISDADLPTNADDMSVAGHLGVGIGTATPLAALEVNDSIIYRPRAGNPTGWPAGNAGELTYSGANDKFYYYNGSDWAAQTGGACFVLYGSGAAVPNCPSGWTMEQNLGAWGYCQESSYLGGIYGPKMAYSPPGGSCGMYAPGFFGIWIYSSYWSKVVNGQAVLCCK